MSGDEGSLVEITCRLLTFTTSVQGLAFRYLTRYIFDTGRLFAQLEVDDGRAGLRLLLVGDRSWVLLLSSEAFDGLRGLCFRNIPQCNVRTPFESMTVQTLISMASLRVHQFSLLVDTVLP